VSRSDLNPADPDYQLRKLRAELAEAMDTRGVPDPGLDPLFSPAGWWEEDPNVEGGLIYHAPPGVDIDPDNPVIPFSSNFVPDAYGGGTVLQAL
jgi:hypothetical protein